MTMTDSPTPVVDTGSDVGHTDPEELDVSREELPAEPGDLSGRV